VSSFGGARLLVVDDETAMVRALCSTLEIEGYVVRGFDSAREALASLQPGEFDLLLTDLSMPDMDGVELIAAVRQIDPAIDAVVMTGHGTIDTAVKAMQAGALDYVLKPCRLNVVRSVISRALELQRLRREHAVMQLREKRRADELAAAYRDLEAFAYSISHDLRTPLTFVKGFAKKLETQYGPQMSEDGRNMLRIVMDGSQNMDDMIVGLLAFSQAGRQKLQLEQLDMSALARAAVHEALSAYSGPAPHIDIASLPAAPGDSTVMRHVWSNLVGNALKYSARRPQPQIRIEGHVDGDHAIYSVQDNGVGFDMSRADRLFGVFKRLHSAEDFPGTGVGLAIVQRIVTRHGGQVWAEGAPDAGACLQFSLPVAAVD
jgi:two-component system, sensor histidine kinase and response regulator